jgi:hypothetical protein
MKWADEQNRIDDERSPYFWYLYANLDSLSVSLNSVARLLA